MSTRNDDTIDAELELENEQPLLEVRNLHAYFRTDGEDVKAVDGISLTVDPGETVAIVGESGSGKTVTSEAITRLFASPPGYIPSGSIEINGREITELSAEELRRVRGGEVSHVFQNPQGALNPVYTVGWQIREAIRLHADVSGDEARERAVELLTRVGIPEASSRLDDYPHEFSGGMKQRVLIAIALACEPDLLIADEPTTALDVTIQAQILKLLRELQDERDMGLLFITHDLGVVAEIADRVAVMYAGKIMERGSVTDIFETPAHPYTRALLECLPGRGELGGIPGDLPDPRSPPPGCRFADRCPHAVEACRDGGQPPMYRVGDAPDHTTSCVHFGPGRDSATVLGTDAGQQTDPDPNPDPDPDPESAPSAGPSDDEERSDRR
ncbi:ABC transporter ATP-binding protein [Halosolutus gelatinilyticus]|uniref:ABC transporter ATP-binding protein n=1 Tax=Halosolutus gelatinilyticus TaxID=2931975 RepID=UPI001FF26044|nr:ABC transporter ATP-binding protein [Halosolutus gelatinilyticus]